jgi:hypothetical protein
MRGHNAFQELVSGAGFWGWFLGFAASGDVGAPFGIPEMAHPVA